VVDALRERLEGEDVLAMMQGNAERLGLRPPEVIAIGKETIQSMSDKSDQGGLTRAIWQHIEDILDETFTSEIQKAIQEHPMSSVLRIIRSRLREKRAETNRLLERSLFAHVVGRMEISSSDVPPLLDAFDRELP
jgi:hypothetical protein